MASYTIDDFLANASASETSRAHYREVLTRLEAWAGGPLGDLSVAKLDGLMARLRKMQSGPHYANILRMFYNRASMENHAKRTRLKQRLKKLRPEDILSVAEVQRLIDATNNTRDRAFIAALYETGVRVSELCALNLGNVRFKEADGGPAGYVVWFGRTKIAGEEHQGFIFESRAAVETWLKAHPDPQNPEAPLFPTWNGRHRLNRKDAWSVVEGAAKRAKIGKHVYPHLFRHSRATHLLGRGLTEAQVKKLLGWAPGSLMLNRYAHLSNDDAERAALQAAGLPLPERVDIGKLDFSEERLRPIVPVMAPPGERLSPEAELNAMRAEMESMRSAFSEFMERARVWDDHEMAARVTGIEEAMKSKAKPKSK